MSCPAQQAPWLNIVEHHLSSDMVEKNRQCTSVTFKICKQFTYLLKKCESSYWLNGIRVPLALKDIQNRRQCSRSIIGFIFVTRKISSSSWFKIKLFIVIFAHILRFPFLSITHLLKHLWSASLLPEDGRNLRIFLNIALFVPSCMSLIGPNFSYQQGVNETMNILSRANAECEVLLV